MLHASQKIAEYALIPVKVILTGAIAILVFPFWLALRIGVFAFRAVRFIALLPIRTFRLALPRSEPVKSNETQLAFSWAAEEGAGASSEDKNAAAHLRRAFLFPFQLVRRSAAMALEGAAFIASSPLRFVRRMLGDKSKRPKRKSTRRATKKPNAPPPTDSSTRKKTRKKVPPVTLASFVLLPFQFALRMALLPLKGVVFIATLPLRVFRSIFARLTKRPPHRSTRQAKEIELPTAPSEPPRTARKAVAKPREGSTSRKRSLGAHICLGIIDLVVVAAIAVGVVVTIGDNEVPQDAAVALPVLFAVLFVLRHIVYSFLFPSMGFPQRRYRFVALFTAYIVRPVIRLAQFAAFTAALAGMAFIGGSPSPGGAIAFASVISFIGVASMQDLQSGRTQMPRGWRVNPIPMGGSGGSMGSFPPTVLVREKETFVFVREIVKGGDS